MVLESRDFDQQEWTQLIIETKLNKAKCIKFKSQYKPVYLYKMFWELTLNFKY